MRMRIVVASLGGLVISAAVRAAAPEPRRVAPGSDETADPTATEQWEPVPPIVTPGPTDGAPPSDAIVLFDGRNLDQWVMTNDHSPARWKVAEGVITVDKSAGNIETKQTFRNYQLHLEWR